MTTSGEVDVHPLPVPVLVRLVNGWGTAPRHAAGEAETPYPEPSALRDAIDEPWADAALVTSLEIPALVEASDEVHPLFASETAGELAERLTRLVGDVGMSTAFTAAGGRLREVRRIENGDRVLLASATLTLVERLRHDPDVRRLGVCQGDDCADVYVDASPAGRRRFCSVTCQNRHRTRTYRARRRSS